MSLRRPSPIGPRSEFQMMGRMGVITDSRETRDWDPRIRIPTGSDEGQHRTKRGQAVDVMGTRPGGHLGSCATRYRVGGLR